MTYLVIKLCLILEHRLSSLDIEQDIRESTDGVLIPPHHHIHKSYVIVRSDLTARYSRIQILCEIKK